MSPRPWLLFAAGLLVGTLATAWWTSTRPSTPTTPPVPERKVLYWYDPMVPNQHFPQPGKSPFMDMALVPKYADEPAAPGSVAIDPRLVQNSGLRTGRATRASLRSPVYAPATIEADERLVSAVQARVPGIVETLHLRTPFSAVRAGQPLLTILAPEWTAAQEEYLALRRATAPGLDALQAAARRRLVLLGMDDVAIRQVERSGTAQTRHVVRSPRDGVLRELAVREGASVSPGAAMGQVAGLDTVWVQASVAETQIAHVTVGTRADITVPTWPGERRSGVVDTVLPLLDPATRTRTIRITLDNEGHRLVPGMTAQVHFAREGDVAVQVPSEAVIATGRRHVVIVRDDGGFRAQEVRIGEESGDRTAILEGIAENEEVVLSGQFLIDSEASLRGTLARLENPQAEVTPAFDATGIVEAIDGTQWTIATDSIDALDMPAMRMGFTAPPSAGIAPQPVGDRVQLRFRRNAEAWELVAVTPVSADTQDRRP
ncbi:efflux RND transporter periplasmic adaptor subunit [Tahibacter amnicola]|uniref:Efflux RND transporter periplasmic adaptor subunit n=1 Tax=Tahibacter amnicola TaxID=2976241 RepID=A0ABY6B8W6_9GAMM|nr:efflux RND transporter periplasmic adaptor subunit [Tahibacter amnicola]UXI66315.1 efflux RND transporter periplasmic adaptor subunit [Tahibacter amnicola]